jgi:hypothetical protein
VQVYGHSAASDAWVELGSESMATGAWTVMPDKSYKCRAWAWAQIPAGGFDKVEVAAKAEHLDSSLSVTALITTTTPTL